MNRREFLLSSGGAVLSASMTSVHAATPGGSCAANVNDSRVQMIDLSHSLTLDEIERLSGLGVRTIGRYYVHPDADFHCIPSKLFSDDEFTAFKVFNAKPGSPKMAVVTAYQECNGCGKFVGDQKELKDKAQADGEKAASLAGHYNQPQTSPIYFGVDFNAHPFIGTPGNPEEQCRKDDYQSQKDIEDRITLYFTEVGKQVRKKGRWPIGVYAGGDVCKLLKTPGLAKYFWLRASLGDYGTPRFYREKTWHIFQSRNEIKNYRGISIEGNIDVDITNPLKSYYGQWAPGEAALPQGPSAADAERIMLGRAFYPVASKGYFQRDETSGELAKPIGDTPIPAQGRTCRLVKCFSAQAGIAESAGVSFEEGDEIQAYFYLQDLVVGLPYDGMPKLGDQPRDNS
jgi:hypothetical protein